jgi:peptide/nickel transport system substrate-binding protein
MAGTRTRSRAGIATVLAGLGLAGCGKAAGPDLDLRVAVPYDLSSLDPHAKNSVGAYEMLSAVYEPLVTLDRSMRPVPALAVSWETPEPLTWVFRLRPGVRFHDGSPLSSEDVVASVRRLISEDHLEMRSFLNGVAEVSARGNDTVAVRTLRPNAELASRLHFALVVPRGSTPESLAGRANGTGPFAVAAWRPSSLALQRNRRYWGEAAGAARVRIDFGISAATALEQSSGAPYDLIVGARRAEEEARRSDRYLIVEEENIFLRHLAFDVARERTPFAAGIPNPFRRREVREAVNLALDRERLAAAAGPGARPAYQLVPRAVFGHDPGQPAVTPDPPRARALLAQAGLAHGFEVVLHRPSGFSTAAEIVREQLAGVGIRVRVESLPSAAFFDALDARKLSFWFVASGCATGDGMELLEASFHSPGPGGLGVDNYGDYRNPDLDRGILEAGGLFDLRVRQAAVQGLLERVLEDRVWIPLYHDRGALLIARGLAYEPRADGYLRLAGLRPARSR